jgi:hypothetical protein
MNKSGFVHTLLTPGAKVRRSDDPITSQRARPRHPPSHYPVTVTPSELTESKVDLTEGESKETILSARERKNVYSHSVPTPTVTIWPPCVATFFHAPSPTWPPNQPTRAPPSVHAPAPPFRPRPRTRVKKPSPRTHSRDLPSTFPSPSLGPGLRLTASTSSSSRGRCAADLTRSIPGDEASPPGPLLRGTRPRRQGLPWVLRHAAVADGDGSQLPRSRSRPFPGAGVLPGPMVPSYAVAFSRRA